MNLFQKQTETQHVVGLAPTETVLAAARLMTGKSIGAVVVMSKDRLEGIFTERDLLNRVVAKGLDPQKVLLSEVMSKNVVTVSIQDSLEDCYEKMQQTRARHVPIVNDGKVVGMVTMRNILEWLWKEIEEENNHLKSYIQQS